MEFFQHVINGVEVPSVDGQTMADIDPYTQEQWATVALGSKADADKAVAAGREAFDHGPWPRMGYEKRQQILHRFADLMDEHSQELALADTLDMGKPVTQALHDVARSLVERPILRRSCSLKHGRHIPNGLRSSRVLGSWSRRCSGRYFPVEFSAHDEHMEGRSGIGVGEHGGAQARRGQSSIRDDLGQARLWRRESHLAC